MIDRRHLVVILAGTVWLLAGPAVSQMDMIGFEERTIQTASYTIKIRTGPVVSMADLAMTVIDQGMPVNRHIEIHVFRAGTDVEAKDLIPVFQITDQLTGVTRALVNITACLTANHRITEPHFGDNVYLPAGMYTISVTVGETAIFGDVVL